MDATSKEAAATAAPIANISGSSDNTLSSVENTDIMKSTAGTEKEDLVSSNNDNVGVLVIATKNLGMRWKQHLRKLLLTQTQVIVQ